MTQIQVSFDEKKLREVLLGDRGAEVLLEKVMNEILQAEMTVHLGAVPSEQTNDRRGYRKRELRVDAIHARRFSKAGGAQGSRRHI